MKSFTQTKYTNCKQRLILHMFNEINTLVPNESLSRFISKCVVGLLYVYHLLSGSYNPDGLNGRCYYCPTGFTTKGNGATSVDDCTGEM